MRVAVIGAGASGLCVARHLTANVNFSCIVYEQTGNVGGTWVYTEATGTDEFGLPITSSMYKNLRTNAPTMITQFPDFPFISENTFTDASEVLHYLEDYCDHFNLKDHIKFFHSVKCVKPEKDKWHVVSVDLLRNREYVDYFDAVAVCIGHFSVPKVPDLPGITSFQGEVFHSHSYRVPEVFKDQTLLVVGAGFSGTDVTFDTSKFASKVYLSHRAAKLGLFSDNVEEVPLVKEVLGDHVIFDDDTTSEHIDVIILCTGYIYSFPFLSPECGINIVDGNYVEPLYKHVININHPTMGFIALTRRTFTFPLFNQQALFFVKSLKEFQLPSREEMLADLNSFIKEKQDRNLPMTTYHDLYDELKDYMGQLEKMAGLKPLSPIYYNLFYALIALSKICPKDYKNAVVKVVNDYDFEISGVDADKEELIRNKYHVVPGNQD
ncbi:senecionine N-oxygenase-like [Macrosteles quadrilineatus]|uniref:senecionine N-oxygenase-like n=1 Tax=Macrosteles quadrilineatus TaxID=74068 RepID=UPI0023E2B245|nr:senecionine N-oxygenase-like [Macrosteles quadrilineatus]